MKVAIPTKNGRIDQQYSRALEFTVYDVEIELVKQKEIIPLGKTSISDFLTEQGINAEIKTCISNEVKSKAQSFKPDIIISNVGKSIAVPEGIPVVYGVNLLSGRGADETWAEILEIRNNQ